MGTVYYSCTTPTVAKETHCCEKSTQELQVLCFQQVTWPNESLEKPAETVELEHGEYGTKPLRVFGKHILLGNTTYIRENTKLFGAVLSDIEATSSRSMASRFGKHTTYSAHFGCSRALWHLEHLTPKSVNENIGSGVCQTRNNIYPPFGRAEFEIRGTIPRTP
jgi:hypothetical protein